MTNRLKRILNGTRALESRLTAAFEQAAHTVAAPAAVASPLEVIDLAVDEVASHVQPAGRGRYTFPFNSVTITFAVPTPEDGARFEGICAGPPSIDERAVRRLVSAGCDAAAVDLDVIVAFENVGTGFRIALARVGAADRVPRGPAVRVDLVVTNGTATAEAYSFTTLPIAIGRGADVRNSRNQLLRINHVVFTEGVGDINGTVSRRHARIELDEATGRPRLIDDNSAQGTSVIRGGRGIAVPRGSRGLGLQSDDEIVLGEARLKVRLQ